MKSLPRIITPERTILTRRPCKYCGSEIYLQYIPVSPKLNWICFDSTDGKLYDCLPRLLAPETKQLIQSAIERMNYHNSKNNNTKLAHDIDMIIQGLKDTRQRFLLV